MDDLAKNMDYPAAMSKARPVSPMINASPIVCSEFRKGRGYTNWRPAGSGDWLLISTAGGEGRVVAGGRDIRLGAGDAVLFAPGTAQDYSTDETVGEWHLRWAHFWPRPHWQRWLIWPEIAPGVGRFRLRDARAEAVGVAFARMLAASRLGGASGDDLAMNALEEVLIRAIDFADDRNPSGADPRVQRAARYLADHPDEPFNLGRLAAHCGISPSRLSHLFRAGMGSTPQVFGEKLRLEHARQLLVQTRLTTGEIALEVGFSDPLYFSRRFKRAFGHPPAAARNPGSIRTT
jgi:AraC family transcriptional regulator, arabinose operon regulatory protein